MYDSLRPIIEQELADIASSGMQKKEIPISSPQGRIVQTEHGSMLNFCANNYLGLSGNKAIAGAAKKALDTWGFGLSSVRFICGTQDVHKELERATARFLEMEDAILYTSCAAANIGFFASFLGEEDVVLSDELNHATIIDGVRLSKAERRVWKHMDMADLKRALEETKDKRVRVIVTDGVFSMDGDIAPLREICDLADRYHALVVVDDSHATGFMGANGRGTHEHCDVMGRVDVIISTYGKALGGANGGFTAGKKELVELLRQRSRSYLFSNSMAPVIAAGSLAALRYIQKHPELRTRLWENTRLFRDLMQKKGFVLPADEHPIVPVMIGNEQKNARMAAAVRAQGIYVIGFSYPVVPKGKARIRVQLSSEHTKQDIERAVRAFETASAKER